MTFGQGGDLRDFPMSADVVSSLGGPVLFHTMHGFAALHRGEFATAREAFRKALDMEGGADLQLTILMGMATAYYYEGNAPEATRYLIQAAESIERSIDDLDVEKKAGYLATYRRQVFEGLVELQVKQGCLEEAFVYSEKARSRAFLQMIGSGAERIPGDVRDSAALVPVTPAGVATIQHDLPPETTMIAYFVTPHRMHVWVVDRESFHHFARPMTPARLQRLVCWGSQLEQLARPRGVTPKDERCGKDIATAGEAFEELFAPIQHRVRHTRLILIPHDVLHYIPFAALRHPQDGYLIKKYTLTYAPSANSLRFLQAMETPLDGTVLVLGDPPGARLPGTNREAHHVASSFGVTANVSRRACESLLYDLAGKVDLVHLGAHAYYDAKDPLASYVALARCGKHDGRLKAQEILETLDFRGVNLVVLSACSTGVGLRSGGDEVVGLTRSVLSAGSPGVISTLWAIEDRDTAQLMKVFYRDLLKGRSAADALRAAQLAMLDKGPATWAAFSLHGNPRACWKRQAPR